jgi:hypothetical protein
MGYPLRWEQLAVREDSIPVVEKNPERPTSLRSYFRKLIAVTAAGSTLLIGVGIGVSSVYLNSGQARPLQLESVEAGTTVSAEAPQAVRSVGFVRVSGNLVNRSDVSLDKVEAVVDLLDGEKRTLRTESALVARNQIEPGQASGFSVEMHDDPAAAAYRVRFKQLYGEALR